MEALITTLDVLSTSIALVGGAVIMLGVISAIYRLIRVELSIFQGIDADHDRRSLRHHFGYYILLGLEFLIAADVLRTLIHPSTTELVTLAVVVLLRTVISVTLNWELSRPERAKEDHP